MISDNVSYMFWYVPVLVCYVCYFYDSVCSCLLCLCFVMLWFAMSTFQYDSGLLCLCIVMFMFCYVMFMYLTLKTLSRMLAYSLFFIPLLVNACHPRNHSLQSLKTKQKIQTQNISIHETANINETNIIIPSQFPPVNIACVLRKPMLENCYSTIHNIQKHEHNKTYN